MSTAGVVEALVSLSVVSTLSAHSTETLYRVDSVLDVDPVTLFLGDAVLSGDIDVVVYNYDDVSASMAVEAVHSSFSAFGMEFLFNTTYGGASSSSGGEAAWTSVEW